MMPAGSINAWKCEKCGCYTVAIHKHRGTTPMFLGCRAMEGCDGRAVSLGYPQGRVPDEFMAQLKWEWYAPTRAEMYELEPNLKQHVIQGGLLLRELVQEQPAAPSALDPERLGPATMHQDGSGEPIADPKGKG